MTSRLYSAATLNICSLYRSDLVVAASDLAVVHLHHLIHPLITGVLYYVVGWRCSRLLDGADDPRDHRRLH